MKCQNLFSWENNKKFINLSSAELAQRVIYRLKETCQKKKKKKKGLNCTLISLGTYILKFH